MNNHLFSNTIQKQTSRNSWRLGAIITTLILSLILAGCNNATIEPELQSSPDRVNPQQTLSASQTVLNNTSTPTSETTPTPEETSSPIATKPSPTSMPTMTPSSTPTTLLPELLIAAIEVKQKGEADEFHEVWLVNTLTGEKRLAFTTTPGTSLTKIKWGPEQSNILYVAEIKEKGENHIVWQLYEINYETGDNREFFTEPLEGLPTMLDLSAQGKWLRIWVSYSEPGSLEWWFINTEDGTITRYDQDAPYLSGFVWSPNEPDEFAYSQEASVNGDTRTPQSLIISKMPDFETINTIDYQYTNWGGEPLLMWDSSEPEHILFFTLGEMYIVDLDEKEWDQIAQGLDVIPGDGYTQLLKSPSGQWAVTTTFIRAIKLNDVPKVAERFDDKIGLGHEFLSWYNDRDWMVISTRDGRVLTYAPGDNFDLIREVNLNDYGLTSPGLSTLLAKPLPE